MKAKYGYAHLSDYDYTKMVTPYKGATKEQYEKKHTIPDHAVNIKKLVQRIENGKPKPTE